MAISRDSLLQFLDAEAPISFLFERDWYSMTWLASHIRIVVLLPAQPTSTEERLAYVLRDGERVQAAVTKIWLTCYKFLPAERTDTESLLARAQSDLTEGADPEMHGNHADEISQSVLPLDEFRFEPFSDAVRIDTRWPCSKYQHGPTDQMFWRVE